MAVAFSRRWGVGAAFAAGTAVTLGLIDLPGIQSAYRAPALHVALETAGAVVAFVAAYLVYGRFRSSGRGDDLLLVAAMGAISFTNLFFIVVPSVAPQASISGIRTWAALPGRLIGALLLAAAALAPAIRLKSPRRTAALLGGGLAVAFATIWITVATLSGELPVGVNPTFSPHEVRYSYFSGHPVVSAAQFLGMVLHLIAAVGFSRRAEDDEYEFRWWLAAAASFAALASLNYGLFPSLYTEWVFIGDVFRFLFYVVLLTGAFRVILAYWRHLADAAVLEERGRLARDMHDGLAQELAFIARRSRQMSMSDDGAASQIAAAAQRALLDSRLAIAALTRSEDEPLDVSLEKVVNDTATRVGATVTCDLERDVHVGAEAREALIRIATEAVSNAARHAEGSIRVVLTRDPSVCLRVIDDGVGFDPDNVMRTTHSGFGLTSMRERAKALGADFRVSSRPGEGTEVEVVLTS